MAAFNYPTDRVGSVPEYLTPGDIRQAAEAQVAQERYREQLAAEIVRVRARQSKPWWKRILPTVTITWNKP